MQNYRVARASRRGAARTLPVSPGNPCPFLRALVAQGVVNDHVVPLSVLCKAIVAASGKTGLQKYRVAFGAYQVALIANGVSPGRLLRTWWSGVRLDALRNGLLDKRGVGSRILDPNGNVYESEIARLAEFGQDQPDPEGGTERGLTKTQINTYMRANLDRSEGARRAIDPALMNGEWPVLLDIMGKQEEERRYLSVAEVRTLFVERRLPDRIMERLKGLTADAPNEIGRLGAVLPALRRAIVAIAACAVVIFAVGHFPDRLAPLLPPSLPDRPPIRQAYWLNQNWSKEDRYWFHHVSVGTTTFPVPYAWFVALEQPGIQLLSQPGLLADSGYLERFGFLPSPKSIRTDAETLRRFGFSPSPVPESQPDRLPLKAPADNLDGLPVGFARMTGVPDPSTGRPQADKLGLTCAACHTGSIRYKDVSIRIDGGAAMIDFKKLEVATGLAIAYTLWVPGRFDRFATRVLGFDAADADRRKLKQQLSDVAESLLQYAKVYDRTIAGKRTADGQQQSDTEEGFGRLDSLNRIGNQIFYTDLAANGGSEFARNLHAQNAPVSFPPLWTVPWFKFTQYDASIQQPLIRNTSETLGLAAQLNLSDDANQVFRSSASIRDISWIESLLRGPEPFAPKTFGGLSAPKWPSEQLRDEAWNLDPKRVERGRAIYMEMCRGCHLDPVGTDGFWSSESWQSNKDSKVLNLVTVPAGEIGTDVEQANVMAGRTVHLPEFLNVQPTRDLQGCQGLPPSSTTEMPYSLALITVTDLVARRSAEGGADQSIAWDRDRPNCINPDPGPRYSARPLNGIWATAPYLHNGSVPSLYWLLKPAAERPQRFCMGNRDYDPRQVGFAVVEGENCKTGETLFSTTRPDGTRIRGNSVGGHSFEQRAGEARKPGVIGRMLTEQERYELIEYLKTL